MAAEKHTNAEGSQSDRIAELEREIRELTARNREVESQFDFLLDQLPIVFSVFDEKGVFQQLTGLGLNRLKIPPNAANGHSVFELYSELKPVLTAVRRALEGEAIAGDWEFERDQYYRFAYKPIWNDEEQLTRVLGVALDITDLIREQRKNAHSAQQLEFFIKHVPAAIATFDKEMRYLRVSDRWIEDYRLEGIELIGRTHYEVFPETPDRWKKVHERCLKGAVESCLEDPLPRQNGHVDYVNWVSTPWYDEQDEVGGLIFFTEVINEQVEAKDNLIRLNKQLGNTNQRLEHFSQVVGKQVLGPLNMLIEWAEQLQENAESRTPDDLRKSAELMTNEALAVRELIGGFLEFNEMGKPASYEELDVIQIIKQIEAELRPQYSEQNIQLSYKELPAIRGNEPQISALFKHLLKNAIIFNTSDRVKIDITATASGEEWIFQVQDNGIGIEAGQEKEVFTLLKHLDPDDQYPGVGVGLTVCLRIIQSVGGKIWIEPIPGEGTSVYFSWPQQISH